jgi:hypothetical protein
VTFSARNSTGKVAEHREEIIFPDSTSFKGPTEEEKPPREGDLSLEIALKSSFLGALTAEQVNLS